MWTVTWNGLTYSYVASSASSVITIDKILTIFTALGLPEMVVSDNGICFSSQEFQNFMKQNGIQHVRTAAYHPSLNCLAECYIQIMKDDLRKIISGLVEPWLARLLSCHRVTLQSVTGVSPAELMFGRKLRTRLELFQPDLGNWVRQKQAMQEQNHNVHSK